MTTTDPSTPFNSSLSTGAERFLSEVVQHGLSHGRRTPADFIRHFSAGTIMDSLTEVPPVRARFLVTLVGVRERTAIRTPAEDAGRLLQAALDEGDCDAEAIVAVFDPDDRVRYLDPHLLWSFLTEGDFWKVSRAKDAAGHKVAQAHIAYMLERALAAGLIKHIDIIEGVTVELLSDKLPRAELAKLVRATLDAGREGRAFTDADVFSAVPLGVLVDHVPLPQIVAGVIAPMARAAGYEAPAGAPAEEASDGFPAFESV